MLLLAASLFFTEPAPLEMPRAEAFFVREQEKMRLEDRYDRFDLWVTRTVDGCWVDADGREFMTATLAVKPPALTATDSLTRTAYVSAETPLLKKRDDDLFTAIDKLSPVASTEEFVRPRQLCRGYREIRYYEGTNETAIVCAFLPEKADVWELATWTLAEEDDPVEARKRFETEFLEKRPAKPKANRLKAAAGERALLRADARHSVAAYESWHVTDGDTFTILDDLPTSETFRQSVSNELARMQTLYAQTVPTPVDGSNALCVARIFASRADYLKALGVNGHEDLEWSAAYWSPGRRELVAYLPADGGAALLKTLRHEAFHQYLSYATAFIATSPWFNEGYAQYFEEEGSEKLITPEEAEGLKDFIAPLLAMDYTAFYDGSEEERALKYRLAHSLAVFIEKGAPNVRFQPFKNLKRLYVSTLLETKDGSRATAAAFRNQDGLELFIAEWVKFWKQG